MSKLKSLFWNIVWTYVFAQAILGWYHLFQGLYELLKERRNR